MSGRSRKMYQSFKPKTEGAIFVKRSMPQSAKNSPHDTTTSFVKLAAFGTYKFAESANEFNRPTHNRLTMRLMPSLIRGTFQFTRKPSRCPESFRYVSNWAS